MPLWLAGDFLAAQRGDAELNESVPALLYVVMDGHVLDRCSDNAALGCSSLVEGITQFPAYGTPQEQTAIRQALEQLYAPYDLVIVDEPPLPYVPYLLAVVGGSSSLIGHERTSCGIATLSCGADLRNIVSLTFAVSCGGPESTLDVAEVAAQEVAHNLGLEHTSSWTDIMFPTVNDNDRVFEDQCNEILTPDYDDAWACPDVHVLDCPDGAGGQQNSHAELLRILGPRRDDSDPPIIVETTPADQDVLTAGDTVQVYGSVDEDSGAVGVRWTWLDGPGLEDAEIVTRCTNGVCDAGYERWKPIDEPWPFIEIIDAAPGVYRFRLEVSDLHGNLAQEELSVEVVEQPDDGEPTTGTDMGAGGDNDVGSQDDDGCSCRTPERGPQLSWSWIPVLVVARRRTWFRPGS